MKQAVLKEITWEKGAGGIPTHDLRPWVFLPWAFLALITAILHLSIRAIRPNGSCYLEGPKAVTSIHGLEIGIKPSFARGTYTQ